MEMKGVIGSLWILEAVAQHQPVTAGELTNRFGLPKSTVRRTLVTLNEAGWPQANRKDTTRREIGAQVLAVRPPPRAPPGALPRPSSREGSARPSGEQW